MIVMANDRLDKILGKKRNGKGQSMVSLDEMEVLLGDGGVVARLNGEVGSCYSHIVKYEGREFFGVTGNRVGYNPEEERFSVGNKWDRL